MIAQRSYNVIPRVQAGYPLNPDRGWFSVLVPVARTNLVTNPSFELGTTDWAAISGGTLAQSAAQQFYGTYSAIYTPTANTTDGIRYTGALSLTNGTLYAYQIRFLGIGGHSYKLALTSSGNIEVTSVVFVATGSWQWIYGYYTAASTATHRIAITKDNDVGVLPFYVDGVQVEALAAGETISTYIDGDQMGLVPNQLPPAFFWNGTPHASSSSRSGQTRAGGMIVNIQDAFRFFLTAIVGLGMSVPQHVATEYALLDGSQYNYTRKPARQFTLMGQMNAPDPQQLRTNRADLSALLDRDLIGTQQPLCLRYQPYQCLSEIGNEAEIVAIYDGGLEGNDTNHYAQDVPLHFTAYLPFIRGVGEGGTALGVQTTTTNANFILERLTSGVWQALSTGLTGGAVNVITIAPDGKVYVGGAFTLAGGVANTVRIAYWDPIALTWNAMGTGAASGQVSAIVIGADGTVYAGGTFSGMGGVANTKNIAKWNGSAWSAMGTGVTTGTDVNALAADHLGNVYAGGTFTQMGGVANTLRLAKWNGSAWSALGTGADNTVYSLATDPANNLYIGGLFLNINGTAVNFVAKWDGSAITALSTGMNQIVFALGFGLDNRLYAAGSFTTAGGVSAAHAAVWNGVAWSALGTGLDSDARTIVPAPDGTVWFSGSFTTAAGVSPPSPLVQWNGASFVPSDSNLVAATTVFGLAFDRAGNMYVGYGTNGSATSAGLTTVAYAGTVKTYPTITIKGPSSGTARIYSITNPTTGQAVYLNYTMLAGETATLVFTPDELSFTSTFQGNIANTIMPGSDEADFFLQPGNNTILLYSSVSTVTASARWRNNLASLDDLIR
jgi:hypothetical protein